MAMTDSVLVAGANGALGRQIVAHYLAEKRHVVALDREFQNESLPEGDFTPIELDLSTETELDQALDALESAGKRVVLLVNLIGLIWNEPLLALRDRRLAVHDIDSWRKVVESNLTAPFILASRVAARMARHGSGSIVNFSSIASVGHAGQAAYGAAKAGLEALTRAMAAEYGPVGVRANAIALGFIDAETTRAALDEKKLQDYTRATPVNRLGNIEEVIDAIAFLDANTFVNGVVLKLDGGLRL